MRRFSSVAAAAQASLGPHAVLNHSVRTLPPSATLAINELSNALLAEGRQVYKLGLGQSPFPVPPLMVQALQDNAQCKDYLPVRGLPALRDAVAQSQRDDGLDGIDAANVIIGPGSKELLYLVQLCYYGELCLPEHSWVSYAPQATLAGRPVTWLPTTLEDNWKLQPESLAAAFGGDSAKPRLMVLNYPSNPTGQTYSAGELEALAAVLRAHRVLVVSDEIYGGCTYDMEAHKSLAHFYPEGTIVLDGVSKRLGAGGWRLGCFSFPGNLSWLADAMAVAASETFTSVSAPIQHACVSAYTRDGRRQLQPYLAGCNAILALLAAHVHAKLSAVPGVKVVCPEGGFYIYPDVAGTARVRSLRAARGAAFSSEAVAQALLADTGVAVLAGRHFGAREDPHTLLRCAFVDFDGEAALRTLPPSGDHRDGDAQAWLQHHCPDVVAAVDAMALWLSSE